jgi:alpha-glucosidase
MTGLHLMRTLPMSALLPVSLSVAQTPVHSLHSPDRRIEVRVVAVDRLRYDVVLRGRPLLQGATLALDVDGTTLGLAPRVRSAKTRRVDQVVEPPVRQKAARLREHYNELRLEMQGRWAVVFRAYDEGVAYRFETSLPQPRVKVFREEVGLQFAGDWPVYFHREESFFSHNERYYQRQPLRELTAEALASTPAVVDADGVKIAIADADIEEYPGLWLKGTGGSALAGTFPPYPLEEKLERDRDLKVVEAADFIAVTKGTRSFPWRVLAIAETDGDLITNPLVYLLQSPSRVEDVSWIRPGKVAWDWYNALNLAGVDFKSGVNTATYKHYIDFASRHGIEYVILDEGWYTLGDLLTVVPEMDVPALLDHAKQKNVGLILWVVWKTLDDQLEPAMAQFEKWGVKGLKIDFMQRDDQKVIDFYHRVCREAARRKMLVDFHGGIRPAHMTRTWPNLLTTEGVLGLEHNKWSDRSDPEHNVTLPFTRMVVGPLDFTPGAMRNAGRRAFAPVFQQPMARGTRCHQLAMYVVYESPLQMLADSPTLYQREPEIMEFLGPVPSVWDETRVLAARLGDYVVVARRSGRDWYLGAMTDWTARELEVPLDFLPEGSYQLDAYQDGVNADRWASDYKRVKQTVTRSTTLKLRMAEGGGWAARLSSARPLVGGPPRPSPTTAGGGEWASSSSPCGHPRHVGVPPRPAGVR